jgi:hypothetical protein
MSARTKMPMFSKARKVVAVPTYGGRLEEPAPSFREGVTGPAEKDLANPDTQPKRRFASFQFTTDHHAVT